MLKDSIKGLMQDVKSAFSKRPALTQAAAVIGAPIFIPMALIADK